jgi:hypothetical protein
MLPDWSRKLIVPSTHLLYGIHVLSNQVRLCVETNHYRYNWGSHDYNEALGIHNVLKGTDIWDVDDALIANEALVGVFSRTTKLWLQTTFGLATSSMNIFDMTSRESFVVEDKTPIRGYLQVANS